MAINLLDMIMSAQGGQTAQTAGAQLGLNQQQSQSAIAALLPAISSALKQNTATPQGLAGLLGALQGGQHEQYLENPQMLGQPQTVNDGNAILGHLFGHAPLQDAPQSKQASALMFLKSYFPSSRQWLWGACPSKQRP